MFFFLENMAPYVHEADRGQLRALITWLRSFFDWARKDKDKRKSVAHAWVANAMDILRDETRRTETDVIDNSYVTPTRINFWRTLKQQPNSLLVVDVSSTSAMAVIEVESRREMQAVMEEVDGFAGADAVKKHNTFPLLHTKHAAAAGVIEGDKSQQALDMLLSNDASKFVCASKEPEDITVFHANRLHKGVDLVDPDGEPYTRVGLEIRFAQLTVHPAKVLSAL